MRLEFWGAAQTVTGSMHLLEVKGRKILLDCGLYQGRRQFALDRNRNFPFSPRQIDAVILSHAHIDHSGNLPSLVKNGFRGNIYATSATRDLAAYMLLDSAHIQEDDVRHLNKYRARRGDPILEPLYDREDAEKTLKRFISIEYDNPFTPIPGIAAHFINAGHMLGSATVIVDVEEPAGKRRLVFSGDIGQKDLPILRDPETPTGAQILIMESTYGDRNHDEKADSLDHLERIVKKVHAQKGKLLIPAFAVGRSQELAYRLNQLAEAGRLPNVDVYVDSPLAVDATEVFRLHPECFDDEAKKAIVTEADRDPIGFTRLRYVRNSETSKRITASPGPMIVISASGMCESGRILHHLRAGISDKKTVILFVGYQAENTLGRKLLDGQKIVRIFGDEYQVEASVERLEGCSAHADRNGLLKWAGEVKAKGAVEQVFLVHGEEGPMQALATGLRQAGFPKVTIPHRGMSVEV